MTCYDVIYSNDAKKFLLKNKVVGIRFLKAFEDISEDAYNNLKLYDVKKLKGDYSKENLFRLRIYKYRALFKVVDNKLFIYVIDIDSRGNIYK